MEFIFQAYDAICKAFTVIKFLVRIGISSEKVFFKTSRPVVVIVHKGFRFDSKIIKDS